MRTLAMTDFPRRALYASAISLCLLSVSAAATATQPDLRSAPAAASRVSLLERLGRLLPPLRGGRQRSGEREGGAGGQVSDVRHADTIHPADPVPVAPERPSPFAITLRERLRSKGANPEPSGPDEAAIERAFGPEGVLRRYIFEGGDKPTFIVEAAARSERDEPLSEESAALLKAVGRELYAVDGRDVGEAAIEQGLSRAQAIEAAKRIYLVKRDSYLAQGRRKAGDLRKVDDELAAHDVVKATDGVNRAYDRKERADRRQERQRVDAERAKANANRPAFDALAQRLRQAGLVPLVDARPNLGGGMNVVYVPADGLSQRTIDTRYETVAFYVRLAGLRLSDEQSPHLKGNRYGGVTVPYLPAR